MKEFTKQKQTRFEEFVHNHAAHILRCADLSHYYLRELCAKTNLKQDAFTVEPDPTYLDIKLNYNVRYALEELASGDYEDLLRTLCHEMAHILTAEIEVIPKLKRMSEVFDPMFERFTEHASRWLYRLYRQYIIDNKIDIATGTIKKS